jgi:peptidoglycan-N-acetylglucosamine deacetylase
MTRFHIAAIIAAILCAIGLAARDFSFAAFVVLMLLIVAGFGVAIPQLQLFGNFICRGAKNKKQVALTFDDGPDRDSTPQLLELLRHEKIPAAFFCVGRRVEENSALASQIAREGHLLENHSYAHSNFTNFFSADRLRDELRRTQAMIEKSSGIAPKFFRPPMGLSNPRVFNAAHDLNLKVIGWSVRSFDTILSEPENIVSGIVKHLEPGAIILLHDGNIPAERLVLTVKLLLAKLRERGYEVVRLDKMLE